MESITPACRQNHVQAQNRYDSAESRLKKGVWRPIFPTGLEIRPHPPIGGPPSQILSRARGRGGHHVSPFQGTCRSAAVDVDGVDIVDAGCDMYFSRPSPLAHEITLRSATTIKFIPPHPGLRSPWAFMFQRCGFSPRRHWFPRITHPKKICVISVISG